jgi:hypothetical protein
VESGLKCFSDSVFTDVNLVSDAFIDVLSEASKDSKCTAFVNYVVENYIDTE